jgi:hypothetical protein
MATTTSRHEQVMTASGLDVLAGIWILISPFVLRFSSGAATTNNVILGMAIAVLAAIRFSGAYSQAWISWINLILGIWVLITPWVLRFSGFHTAATNNVIMGIIVIVLAGWSALASSSYGDTRSGPFEPPA